MRYVIHQFLCLNPDNNSYRMTFRRSGLGLAKESIMGETGLSSLLSTFFSVIANSAGCEWVFSKFGTTHTNLCNKLDPERVYKLAVIGMEVNWVLEDYGIVRNWKKCEFGEDKLTNVMNLEVEVDFWDYAKNLVWQAQVLQQEEEHDTDHTLSSIQPIQPQPTTSTVVPSSQNQELAKLKSHFKIYLIMMLTVLQKEVLGLLAREC